MEIRLKKCRICMDFSFPAMLAILLLCKDTAFLCQTLAVCMIHEAGHGLAMLLTRAGIREITLTAAGMQMRTRSVLLSGRQELAVLCSGPCINFVVSALLYFLHGWTEGALLHLSMGLFNLLPYAVLDGGSALRCIFAKYPLLLRMQTVFCMMLSAGILAVLFHYHIRNPFLYLMCLYLGIAQLRVDKQGGMW